MPSKRNRPLSSSAGRTGLRSNGLKQAIAEAYANNYLGTNILGSGFNLDLRIHASAGRYICGEETALLNALEGKRAVPRAKPPFPQVCGLFGKPTIVNNVETIANIPHIVNNGADWFKGLSKSPDSGTKLYGVSGRVKRPGIWELPMGVTIRELLEEHAGGMHDGYQFRGVIPGGASTDFLVKDHLDVKMDFDSVMKAGSRMGTGTMIVLDDRTCPVGFVHNLIKFFAANPAAGARPAATVFPGRKRSCAPSRKERANRATSNALSSIASFWRRGTPSAPWPPAPSSRSRAR